MITTHRLFVGGLLILLLVAPVAGYAYVGPGAGLGAIGTVIALLGAILLGIVGFVWYPIRRLLDRNRSTEPDVDENELPDADHAKRETTPESQE